MMEGVELVIFDMDGVLVDSEPISCEVTAACLSEIGHPIDAATVGRRYLGVSVAGMLEQIEAERGAPVPEGFAALVERRTLEAYEDRLRPVCGMADLLAAFDGRCCVASSSTPARIARSLELAGLGERFTSLFSATMVAHGKPAPDLFLHAAAAMGCDPGRTIVVEDSVAGVTAGRRAGMHTIGFTAGAHLLADEAHGRRLVEAGADEIVTTATALLHRLTGASP